MSREVSNVTILRVGAVIRTGVSSKQAHARTKQHFRRKNNRLIVWNTGDGRARTIWESIILRKVEICVFLLTNFKWDASLPKADIVIGNFKCENYSGRKKIKSFIDFSSSLLHPGCGTGVGQEHECNAVPSLSWILKTPPMLMSPHHYRHKRSPFMNILLCPAYMSCCCIQGYMQD